MIDGTAVERGSEYGGRTANTSGGVRGDETEDLFDLFSSTKACYFLSYTVPHLTTLQERHPNIRGVSVGAIVFAIAKFIRSYSANIFIFVL